MSEQDYYDQFHELMEWWEQPVVVILYALEKLWSHWLHQFWFEDFENIVYAVP